MRVKKINKVKLDEKVPVYDLSVTDLENFVLANGCVVHNSKDVADSFAAVIYGLTTRLEIWHRFNVPVNQLLRQRIKESDDEPNKPQKSFIPM